MIPHLRLIAWPCLLLSVVAGVGCERGRESGRDDILRPVHRFVDKAPGEGTDDYPTASIDDDTRLVLRAPPRDLIFWPRKVVVPESGRFGFREPLKGALRRSSRVVVLPEIYYPGYSEFLPPLVVDAQPEGAKRMVEADFALPPGLVGKEIRVHLNGYATDIVDLASIRTPEVAVPTDAVLEFAIGMLEAEVGYDPVEFSIDACEADACERIFSEVFDPSVEPEAWKDRRIPLAGLEGTSRSFVFGARRLRADAPLSFPLWANPTLYVPEPRGEGDVNVILLSIDTLRADHLTSYGYRYDTAPFLDRKLAKEGTLFENPVAAATLTTPSHMSMFTSLQPESHGTVDGLSRRLSGDIPTLAELVRENGIDTGAVTEDGWLGVRHGFARGFDSYVENRSVEIQAPEGQVDVTFAEAREWLEWNQDKQFFLFLHTFQVHAPYAPPEKYRDLFRDPDGHAGGGTSPENAERIANYDREIRYTDDELRILFEALAALGLAEDTVFIVTSDHGEAFLEHGALEHGAQMFEEAVRVPLIFRGPGIPRGRRVEVPVAHIDLMPTILELFGIRPPDAIEGTSLRALMEGDGQASRFADRPLFSESHAPRMLGPGHELVDVLPPAYGVRLGSRKLARYRTEDGFRFELYDLASDPGEQNDLFPEQGAQASRLVELIEAYPERSAQVRKRVMGSTDAAPSADQPPGTLLDPEQEAKLRALGYLE